MMSKRISVVVLLIVVVACAGLGSSFIVHLRRQVARANCHNHVRSLALACANYLDINQHFPPGTIRNPELPVEDRLSMTMDL
jgi:hypothetical protein